MEFDSFMEHLNENHDMFGWQKGVHEDKPGIFVKNNQFETITHFTFDAIEKHNLQFLILQTHHGKNVEQITRVTGFFSKVQSWNKGKRGELKDRHRVGDIDK